MSGVDEQPSADQGGVLSRSPQNVSPDLTAIARVPPLDPRQAQQIPPATLAYLGDAVYELYIRTHSLFPTRRLKDYHRVVVNQVNANYQADMAQLLLVDLTDNEKDWLRRGRNAAIRRAQQRVPHAIYQAATGLETLIGYLYLTDGARLQELLAKLPLPTDP